MAASYENVVPDAIPQFCSGITVDVIFLPETTAGKQSSESIPAAESALLDYGCRNQRVSVTGK